MTGESDTPAVRPDVRELLLSRDDRVARETYIFEPAPAEQHLGRLYAVGEIEDRGGVGRELLDMTIQAMQREYYRNPGRGALTSFESALHQANLVLHDAAEQGVRDWMGYFHVAVSILAGETLHISTAGFGSVTLVRKSRVTVLSQDLSYSPVTNPLRTFSQVASGTIMPRDVLFIGTGAFVDLFRSEDLARFSMEHSAATISTRLEQLYQDQQSQAPLATLVVALLPAQVAAAGRTRTTMEVPPPRSRRTAAANLQPRRPIVIHRTALRALLAMAHRSLAQSWRWLKQRAWPAVLSGSVNGSKLLASASQRAGRGAQRLAAGGVTQLRSRSMATPAAAAPATMSEAVQPTRLRSWPRLSMSGLRQAPRRITQSTLAWAVSLPRSSKIFAGLAVVLAIILLISLVLLQNKRAGDTEIQQASETLHDARMKLAAAETALIYNNRDQAQQLLSDVQRATDTLNAGTLYVEETSELTGKAAALRDRLQKIVRTSTIETRVIGDFASKLDGSVPDSVTFVDSRLYSHNPQTNTVLAMTLEGAVDVVTETTEGIGHLGHAIPHEADKTVVYSTDTPGMAVLDTKTSSLQNLDISFTSNDPDITSIAVFGNRLYAYDATADNIFGFSKTLSGYVNGAPWITDDAVPRDSIVSIAIDGSIYTLHQDGMIRELFKGAAADVTFESIEPSLAGATGIITQEGFKHVYAFDPANNRIVVFTKDGLLQRQLFLDVAHDLKAFTVAPDEQTLYVLDGTRVLAVPLTTGT